ncbi:PREDICTED: alpha-2-macroglobulin receptor-associated protein [Myotis davidii]|uniref:alpha-2-macroglobulin receptor-associated protein n=1 Tax=Myotis davidii TaxID=225400 RepID=UPI000766EB07|nr:PREDICTED: alpha-2-macroglobulin receptor-associated protein [Myotis davidii]
MAPRPAVDEGVVRGSVTNEPRGERGTGTSLAKCLTSAAECPGIRGSHCPSTQAAMCPSFRTCMEGVAVISPLRLQVQLRLGPDSVSCWPPGRLWVTRSPGRVVGQRCQASPVPPQLQLSPVDLFELHADLKIQERDEFAWKKLKAEGLDEDGEKEAKLVRNLNGTLAKYRLDGRKDARAPSSNSLTEGPEQDSLEDPRLEKLWHKAKTSGKFSRDELDKLWREFQHHQYNVLLETLSRTEEIQENAINPSDMRRAQEEVLHSRHAELKDRLRHISQGYDRLRKVSHQGYGAEAEFEEPRVIDLWDLAQSANFSEKELEAFREELKHFEVKIEKHNHYQKQLEISHQKLRHVERFGDQEHLSRNKERYALLEEKTKELGYKAGARRARLLCTGRGSWGPRHAAWLLWGTALPEGAGLGQGCPAPRPAPGLGGYVLAWLRSGWRLREPDLGPGTAWP